MHEKEKDMWPPYESMWFQNLIPHLLLGSKLSIIKGLFPNSKEEDKVDKPKDSSDGKDNKEGVLVVHRSKTCELVNTKCPLDHGFFDSAVCVQPFFLPR